MLQFPDSSTFAILLADPRFPVTIGIAILTGIVRGFSGFGTALVYIPLMSALYDPLISVASFSLMDVFTGWLFARGFLGTANWREVGPMVAASIFSAQFGALILQWTDPTTLRWGSTIFVLLVVAALSTGWRYHGKPMLSMSIGVGVLAGLLGGAIRMAGPPIIMYWLGMPRDPKLTRANFLSFFSVLSTALIITYFAHGIITPQVIALVVCITPFHMAAVWGGTRLFHSASERSYRYAAYVIILIAALISMPIFDSLFRP